MWGGKQPKNCMTLDLLITLGKPQLPLPTSQAFVCLVAFSLYSHMNFGGVSVPSYCGWNRSASLTLLFLFWIWGHHTNLVLQLLWLPTHSSPACQAAYPQSPSKCHSLICLLYQFLEPVFHFLHPTTTTKAEALLCLALLDPSYQTSFLHIAPWAFRMLFCFWKAMLLLENFCKDSASLWRRCSIMKHQRARYKKQEEMGQKGFCFSLGPKSTSEAHPLHPGRMGTKCKKVDMVNWERRQLGE